jgi:hypothetical protein
VSEQHGIVANAVGRAKRVRTARSARWLTAASAGLAKLLDSGKYLSDSGEETVAIRAPS